MKIMVPDGNAKHREATPHEDSPGANIETLVEMICATGEEPATALLVLMARLETANDPIALANNLKHLAFTRCGELNACGMVDAQIALLDDKLLTTNAHLS